MNRLEVIGAPEARAERSKRCVKHTVAAKNTNFALGTKGEYFFFTRFDEGAVGPRQRRRGSEARKKFSADDAGALKPLVF
jgi:hypothetical protein